MNFELVHLEYFSVYIVHLKFGNEDLWTVLYLYDFKFVLFRNGILNYPDNFSYCVAWRGLYQKRST